jgi:outer membrane protein OmpA-like peptidoglycan-associated protein
MLRKPVRLLFFPALIVFIVFIVSSCASSPEAAPEELPEETPEAAPEEIQEQPAVQEEEGDDVEAQIDGLIRQLNSYDNVTVAFTTGGVDIAITRAFAPNSSFLDTRLARQLDLVGQALMLINLDTLVIEGHVADVGDPADNRPISEARAANTAEYLTGNFTIPRDAVTTVGRGGADPIAGNTTESGRARNRRVVLFIRGSY